MIDFKKKIAEEISKTVNIEKEEIETYIEKPIDNKNGDYAFPCFRLAKELKKAPPIIANEIKEKIELDTSIIEDVQVVGGYLNFYINKETITKEVLKEISKTEKYGKTNIENGKNIVVDYSSPNIAKPFHIGHLRSTVIGGALYNIYKYLGYNVTGVNHLGDYGTQFGKLIEGYKLWGNEYDIDKDPINELTKIYVRINQACKEDENILNACRDNFKKLEDGDQYCVELWQRFKDLSLKEFQRVYDLLGSKFDSWNGESFYSDKMPEVIEKLEKFHSIDIQWGNHDILWMGATCGNEASIATVIRNCARYNNMSILEDSYGINIRPLSTFAMEMYKDDDCKNFYPKVFDETRYDDSDKMNIAKIHKAITIIQFKLEGQMIKRHPEYNLNNRLLLDKMNLKKGYVLIDGKKYEINDKNFPTLLEDDVYELIPEEKEIMERLSESFKKSEKLNEHIGFLYKKGQLYTKFNSNLLFHACIPMTENGEFKEVEFLGKQLSGKEYLDAVNEAINKIWISKENIEKEKIDLMWYLWISPDSPFFGKDKMATFESYFVKDKEMSKETKNPYYTLTNKEEICDKILKEFGLDEKESHIVNGHMPVKAKDGESPIRGNGKLLVIDGGFAKSYQQKTGNAGYILTYNSNGLLLSQNKPFESVEKAIEEERDIISEIIVKKTGITRKTVNDTDIGKKLRAEIADLEELLKYYENGEIK